MTTNCNEENLPFIIKDISIHYQSRNLPFMWMTWPGVDKPLYLTDILEKYDFAAIGSTAGMALNLEELSEEKSNILGLVITKVKTEEDYKNFFEVFNLVSKLLTKW